MAPRLMPWQLAIRTSRRSTYPTWPPRSQSRFSSSANSNPSQRAGSSASTSRIGRFHDRLPRFLQRYTRPLLDAPLSHITSFLLLHEITAVVPLFGLAYTFHYTHYLPPFFAEWKWVSDSVERFARWFRKKGWLGAEEEAALENEAQANNTTGKRMVWMGRAEGGMRWVVEFATAYAVTKALLPLRLMFSVWATPWFARTAVMPTTAFLRRTLGRRSATIAGGGKGKNTK